MKLFVVEDNARALQNLRDALEAVPELEIVRVVATAEDARAWLSANPDAWDVAVIDLFLAAGHGFEVLRYCRQRQPGQRAVVLSNYTRDPVREHARLAGADAVFDKAFEMESLVAWCEQQGAAA
ncbi:response regulator [Ramlibacter pallidus]|uniref:Response regulator transcription factor n=1 Tax=Ramlibacter pallidus TaxID=2780087 RepID=A0ABR9RZR5_9BURK|nr:response regulator [Ramlibacter pallidus]MBE7366740.1 response regulator transcription factor [Ramlibacter pallidus]